MIEQCPRIQTLAAYNLILSISISISLVLLCFICCLGCSVVLSLKQKSVVCDLNNKILVRDYVAVLLEEGQFVKAIFF